MTRIVGDRNRSEFILDPAQALRQGNLVDAMLASARLPRQQGVLRATHRIMNGIDDQREIETARRLNGRR